VTAAGLWQSSKVKANRAHAPRERPFPAGELIQIDGPHDWFEGRGPKDFMDDATKRVMDR
jgi:hypothetical protein